MELIYKTVARLNPFKRWSWMKVFMLALGLFELVVQAPMFLMIDSAQFRGSLTLPEEILEAFPCRVLFCVFIIYLGLIRLAYCFSEKDNFGAYAVLILAHVIESTTWYTFAFIKLPTSTLTFDWVYQVFIKAATDFNHRHVDDKTSHIGPRTREHDFATLVIVPILTLFIAIFGSKGGASLYAFLRAANSKTLKTVDQVIIFMQVPENMKEEDELVMVLERIGSLCVGNDTNCTEFAKSSAFWPALKNILQSSRLSTSVPIAKYGCRAVNNLARTNDDNKVKLGVSGACEEVARAMRTHSSDAEVAQWGLRAIGNLAFNDSNRSKQGTAGACEEVTRAMKLHSSSRLIAQWGCRAVVYLAHSNSVNKGKLGTAGACEEITSSLQSNLSCPEVAEQGCLAIQELAEGNMDNKMRLRTAGAEAAVALVLARADMGERVKKEARNALVKLS